MDQKNHKPKILVVDDATENLDILFSLLKDEYRIAAAKDGVTGLEIARCNKPDVILLDIMMPGMDGFEVCRRLKSMDETRDIPVIFVTALNQALDEARAFSIGAVDYITKPFVPIVVKARVKTQIDLKMKTDMLEEMASLDGLTNIFNRRKFDAQFDLEWKKAYRQSESLALILADIDHFKAFNDHYGHAVGDECLRQVAGSLRDLLQRPEDFIARYGGEEFVMILPRTDAAGMKHMGEKIIQTVADLAIPHARSAHSGIVTVSAGGAATIPDRDGKGPLGLFKAADDMLYASKHNGRNCLTLTRV